MLVTVVILFKTNYCVIFSYLLTDFCGTFVLYSSNIHAFVHAHTTTSDKVK